MLSLLVRISFCILESHLVPSQHDFLPKKTLFPHFSEAREPTQAAWCSLSHVTEKTWHRFSHSQRGGTGIQWWSIHVPQAAKQEMHRQHKQTQHYFKSTDQRFSEEPLLHWQEKSIVKAFQWGPLGITHLKKAELSVKDKDQRKRSIFWIISWIWLLILRQRKIQWSEAPLNITPVLLPKGPCALLPLLPRRKREGEADNFKAQFN